MNVNKLKSRLVERGLNVAALAAELGIHPVTMYAKLNKFEKITIGEAVKIKAFLGLTDEEAIEIFLS